jgi:GPH family glycoside/pentoside/hexuronide:cation symporter
MQTSAIPTDPIAADASQTGVPGADAAPHTKLPLRIVLGWGIGSIATATMYQANTVLLLRYLVDYVGLAAAFAGAVIGFSKIYDAIVDPFIGILSDRTRSRWGRRRPFILFGGLVSAVSFAALFGAADIDDLTLRNAIAIVALLVNTSGYALVSIPHLSMPTEMTTDFHERTFVMSFRVGALAFAQLSGTVLGPWLILRYGGGAHGHAVMGLVLALIIVAGTVICFFATRGAPATQATAAASRHTAWEKIRLALGNKPFISLMACKFAALMSLGWYFALLPFLFTTVTKAGYGRLGFYFFFQGIAMLCSQPFWVWLSHLIGKKRGFYVATTLYGLGIATWSLALPGEPVGFTVARALFIGVMGGGTLLAATALLPDAIAHDFDRTGLRREAVFAGVYTIVEKASAAIAAALIGLALGLAGYVQATAGGEQPESAVRAIRLIILAPVFFSIAAGAILSTYRLPDRRARRAP